MESTTVKPVDVFRIWCNDGPPAEWRSAIAILATQLLEEIPYFVEHRGAITDEVFAVPGVGSHLEERVLELTWRATSTAAVLGFAMARAWTGNLEDIGTWPERSLAVMADWNGEKSL